MTDPRGLLLDTHVWIWLLTGSRDRLGASTIERIEQAAMTRGIFVSAISVWEVARLEAKGRIRMPKDCLEWVKVALEAPGTRLLQLSPEIAVASSRLPGSFHGDPADRILVASARIHELSLVTKDDRILSYGADHYVSVLPG